MRYKNVYAVFFSATGTTEKTVTVIADTLAEKLCVPRKILDFTLPKSRERVLRFSPDDLVVFGTPVYAGRVPNVLLKYLSSVEGSGSTAIAVVSYGNRNYDDALIELRDILETSGFHTAAAAAFIGEHSFSTVLAQGRPDDKDLDAARSFAFKVSEKLEAAPGITSLPLIEVDGVPHPYRGYYQPRDRMGNPVDIRKVKPLTSDSCDGCLLCAVLCPMGSINRENVSEFSGICIKCGSCIKKCPQKARSYDDEGYLYHKRELEEGLTQRCEPVFFL